VEREPAQLGRGEDRPAVAAGRQRFDTVAIDGDQCELDGDEERRGEDQGDDDAEPDRGVQRDFPPMRAPSSTGTLRCHWLEGTVFAGEGRSSCVRHVCRDDSAYAPSQSM
jgi:hypothetical protein